MKKDLIHAVYNTIKRFDMVEKGQKVLVAVSGGPDSIFLFHALHNLKDKLKINLSIANLDHSIRGMDSEIDSRFVKHMAEAFGFVHIHKKIDPVVYTHSKLSKEEIARGLRYNFLISSAKKIGLHIVATGHTLDDQAETILMRIIKGAGLRGMRGIPPVRRQEGIRIIRPLIEITKQEIKDFLKADSIPYREDHTNLQDIYLRNKIRKRVLPYLARYNPKVKYALVNLAESLREDFEFIESEKKKRATFHSGNGKINLKLKDIIVQPKALRKEIIRDVLYKAGSNIKKLSYKHWKAVDDFIRLRQKGKCIDLPGGIRIKKTQGSLVFFKPPNSST